MRDALDALIAQEQETMPNRQRNVNV
jgi:hypothetical protein